MNAILDPSGDTQARPPLSWILRGAPLPSIETTKIPWAEFPELEDATIRVPSGNQEVTEYPSVCGNMWASPVWSE